MSAVRLDHLWKRYGEVEAVRDLTLSCVDGEMLALLGPSGCGKSSTLKMIAGVETVTRGEIYFDDRPVSVLAPGERNIAMVFEDYALYPHLSVRENIVFPLKVRHFPAAEIGRRLDQALDLLHLEDVKDANVQSLSGGAQQRVSIGRALVRDPEIILFDEPLSHLDADQKIQLRAEIKRLQRTSGLTAILVTHDQTEAVAMSDRVAVMNLGELQQVGPPEELYHRPANLFVAGFIGEPPMNLLSASLCEEGTRTVVVNDHCRLPLSDMMAARLRQNARAREVVVGIRPEHLRVEPDGESAAATAGMVGGVFFRERRGDADVLLIRPNKTNDRDHLEQGDSLVIGEVPGPSPFEAGDRVRLGLPEDRVCLFDARNGQNLMVH